ncbi:DUF742 domain-containing protein [Amycolatopsis vastitatis]|uniref:DUF742 domain-containing protein n=1 Tax=Amycolatopsis vastitatis TaxID=1905142 RepID=A0A229SQ58_9PSEU|nr:DUF742 domain-containing protein [Amycolatopsis vastitatis]OXM60962.1 hypothetical protein CF165_39890 [Amycolatopsis vastitatis]
MREEGEESWFDHDAGPLVRPFALTKGRARADRHALTMITLVLAARPPSEAERINREGATIVRMCQGRPLSVAEISAQLRLLVVVVKVLVSDLIDEGFLVRQTSALPTVNAPDMNLLQAVLDGVRRL